MRMFLRTGALVLLILVSAAATIMLVSYNRFEESVTWTTCETGIPPGARVSGRIVDRVTGRGIEGASVTIEDLQDWPDCKPSSLGAGIHRVNVTTVTDSEGWFDTQDYATQGAELRVTVIAYRCETLRELTSAYHFSWWIDAEDRDREKEPVFQLTCS